VTVLRGWTGWPPGPLHLTFGVFDGVHRGHQDLVRQLADGAHRDGARAVVGTFDTLPQRVLDPNRAPLALTSSDEKAELLTRAGADDVVLWHFDQECSRIEAEDFVSRLLAAGDIRHFVVGPDLVFGHRRAGDVRLLRRVAARRRYSVSEVSPREHGAEAISSTRIRAALVSGDLGHANAMLGREYSVRGTVVSGSGRGRTIGFPTINIETPRERLLPKDGVYAMRVRVQGELVPAAGNLGVRPTFERDGARILEAYLIGRSLDLYDQIVDALFVSYLRGERAFPSAAALREQIAKDVEAVRAAL
jgi:riboflavin kinase / FMN adenylyltransferase